MQEEQQLPNSLEAEQSTLGSVFLDPTKLDEIDVIVTVESFYHTRHRTIFRAFHELSEESAPIDLVSVTSRLEDQGQLEEVGGVSYLAKLASIVPTPQNAAYYADIVAKKHLERDTIRQAWKIAQGSNSGNAAQTIAAMNEASAALADRAAPKKEFTPLREVVQNAFDQVEHNYLNRGENGVTGIPSGFPDLDKMTSGFQRSDLIIVAARPSVGKTAFALNIAQNAGVRHGKKVALFSLEMSETQLAMRMMSADQNIDASHLRTGFMSGDDWEKLTMAVGSLSGGDVFLDDSAMLTVGEIRAKCRRLKKTYGLDMIVIDYLQLIQGDGKSENRQQEVSRISRTLKQIAKELEVPVIALSQLSRGVEQRQDKRPMMSDLRESGSIEQDADIVAFLYRDDYYDKETEKKNVIEIIIAKQRNGPIGTVELVYLKNYNKFVSLDRFSA